MHFMLRHQPWQIGQGAGKYPLIDRGALLDQCRRGIGVATMLDQLLADDRQAYQTHVEHQGLRRRNQIGPRQIGGTVLEMPRDEPHRLRVITMSQRNPGVRRATAGRRDARHDLERDALGCQFLDLFTATAEDERITAFQPYHTLALPGQVHQLLVDLILRHGVIGATLADINPLGITPTQFENCRRHQAVVQHHIGLLHQAQGTEGQQVGITGAGADQIHLTGRHGCFTVDFRLQQTLGFGALPGQLPVGNRPLEHVLPECPALLHVREQAFDLITEARGQTGQLTVGRGNPGFNLGADQTRQDWRIAAAGHGNHQRRAVDDGREDHAAQGRRVHHIDRHATPMGIGGDLCVQRFVIGGGNDQPATVQVRLDVPTQHALATAEGDQFAQLGFDFRCDHPQ